MTIALRIREVRTREGLTAKDLSRFAGLSFAVVAQIERGRNKRPRVSTIDRIARVLGVDLAWLIRGDGRKPSRAEVERAVRNARRAANRSARECA